MLKQLETQNRTKLKKLNFWLNKKYIFARTTYNEMYSRRPVEILWCFFIGGSGQGDFWACLWYYHDTCRCWVVSWMQDCSWMFRVHGDKTWDKMSPAKNKMSAIQINLGINAKVWEFEKPSPLGESTHNFWWRSPFDYDKSDFPLVCPLPHVTSCRGIMRIPHDRKEGRDQFWCAMCAVQQGKKIVTTFDVPCV